MARRKRKRVLGDDPFAIAPVQRREKDGHKHRSREQRDPSIETLKARCRHMNKPINKATLRDQRAPWWGCAAGRTIAMEQMEDDERARLWDAIQHMRKTQVRFDAAIGAPRRHAACLRLLTPTEPMETDAAAPPPDTRSPEERQRQATAALMEMERWLGWTDKTSAGEAKRVVIDDQIVTDAPGLLAALRCVSDGLTGKKPTYRGVLRNRS